MIKFSIIIPLKEFNAYIRETVPYIQAFARCDWELIILPNEPALNEWQDSRIRIIPSGRVGPAKKRDMGVEMAQGEIVVFLDDDSYPDLELLDIAEQYFEDGSIVALGGPAITPPDDSFWQKVSGAVFLSRLSGGAPERYVPMGEPRPVDDWPSVNLMVRRKQFLDIGGFNSPYWPGEDTKLCMDLLQNTSQRILYVPEMRVWHHRRSGLLQHLKQVGAYGLHRGYFARHYPATSRKLKYFAPSLFAIFAVTTLYIKLFPNWVGQVYQPIWCLYGAALLKSMYDIKKTQSLLVTLTALPYIILTHIVYGAKFIFGFLKKTELRSNLR